MRIVAQIFLFLFKAIHSVETDMSMMFNSLLPFLAILNPFALCLYLVDVMVVSGIKKLWLQT